MDNIKFCISEIHNVTDYQTFKGIGTWYPLKENLPSNFRLGSCQNTVTIEKLQLHVCLDFWYIIKI